MSLTFRVRIPSVSREPSPTNPATGPKHPDTSHTTIDDVLIDTGAVDITLRADLAPLIGVTFIPHPKGAKWQFIWAGKKHKIDYGKITLELEDASGAKLRWDAVAGAAALGEMTPAQEFLPNRCSNRSRSIYRKKNEVELIRTKTWEPRAKTAATHRANCTANGVPPAQQF